MAKLPQDQLDIRFQVLQADESAIHLLDWAKHQCRRLIASGQKSFYKTWMVDSATVNAFGSVIANIKLVKLWLVSAAGKFFYSVFATNPCSCRSLFIVVSAPPFPQISYVQLGTVSGQFSCGGRGGYQSYSAYLSGSGVLDGTGGGGIGQGDPCYSLVITPVSSHPVYVAWYQAALAAALAAQGPAAIRVLLSDGTELGSWPVIRDSNGVILNAPVTTVWSGDGYIDLQDGTRVTFDVPDDVCRPALPDTYPLGGAFTVTSYGYISQPAGGGFGQYVASMTVRYSNGSQETFVGSFVVSPVNGGPGAGGWSEWNYSSFPYPTLSQYGASFNIGFISGHATNLPGGLAGLTFTAIPDQGSPSQAALDWAAARKVATERERTRVKHCSDSLISNLGVGAFDSLMKFVRSGRLYSANVFMSDPLLKPPARTKMNVVVEDSQVGSGDDITFTKKVTLSYSYVDSDGATVNDVSDVITGTKHVVITHCANSTGAPNQSSFTTTTYSSWIPVDTDGSTGAPFSDYEFIRDPGFGMCQQWDGQVVQGAANLAQTFDSVGGNFVPPRPVSYDGRVASYPAIYMDYRSRISRAYDKDAILGSISWLDSALSDNEMVDVVPLQTYSSALDDNGVPLGNLGVFPQAADIDSSAEPLLSFGVSRVFTYRYSYASGLFTLVSEKRAFRIDEDGEKQTTNEDGTDAIVTLPYVAGVNFVFLSRSTEWDDVRVKYLEQEGRLRANPEVPPDPPLTAKELMYQAYIAQQGSFQ